MSKCSNQYIIGITKKVLNGYASCNLLKYDAKLLNDVGFHIIQACFKLYQSWISIYHPSKYNCSCM